DPTIPYPRVYHDFFSEFFKPYLSPSHLLKLSVAQGIAQSTLLARHHSVACFVLSSPRNVLTPQQASLGGLHENI
ncbi:uncharacterized protein F5891DRAFT_939099, partial [Suillus fuscotomentosus]